MQWGKGEWGHGNVTVEKVKKSKKNRGQKRKLWQAEVKAFHAGNGKGSGKDAQGATEVKYEKDELPSHPNAPWWKKIHRDQSIEIPDVSEEEPMGQEEEPAPLLMPKIFGP